MASSSVIVTYLNVMHVCVRECYLLYIHIFFPCIWSSIGKYSLSLSVFHHSTRMSFFPHFFFFKPFSLCVLGFICYLCIHNTHAIVCFSSPPPPPSPNFSVSSCIIYRIFLQLFSQNEEKKYFHSKFSGSTCLEWNRSHLFCEMTNAIKFVELFLLLFACSIFCYLFVCLFFFCRCFSQLSKK